MYSLYMGDVLFPVAPSKVETKIKNNNKVVTLIDGRDINILKTAGLSELSFELELPHVVVPYAVYPDGFKEAIYYLKHIEQLKVDKKPFIFSILRAGASGLYQTEYKVSLEDYAIHESVDNGNATYVTIKLKRYREYQTKVLNVNDVNGVKVVSEEKERSKDSAPEKKTYTVVSGDTLWNISKRFLGKGHRYKEIAKLNNIANPNLIHPGQVLKIPS